LYVLSWITAPVLILGTVDSTLLYPFILAISSAISALKFKSFLQKGISSLLSFFSIPKLLRIVNISS
jgi:hypothetical protein